MAKGFDSDAESFVVIMNFNMRGVGKRVLEGFRDRCQLSRIVIDDRFADNPMIGPLMTVVKRGFFPVCVCVRV
jgi:hypothetical protein